MLLFLARSEFQEHGTVQSAFIQVPAVFSAFLQGDRKENSCGLLARDDRELYYSRGENTEGGAHQLAPPRGRLILLPLPQNLATWLCFLQRRAHRSSRTC